jgi:hypothetical protein
MKLAQVKHLIDNYFDKLEPLEIVKHLEHLGYVFEPLTNEDSSYTEKMNTSITVADFIEIEGNHLFENTFYGGDKVNYREKTHILPPTCNFGNDIEGNYTYAMAA